MVHARPSPPQQFKITLNSIDLVASLAVPVIVADIPSETTEAAGAATIPHATENS